jgi:hypothetical protein
LKERDDKKAWLKKYGITMVDKYWDDVDLGPAEQARVDAAAAAAAERADAARRKAAYERAMKYR